MSPSPPYAHLRYMAVVVGSGLMGWAIAGPVGFATGLGAGLVAVGFTAWVVARIAAAANPPALRIVLDSAAFARLVRGQWVAQPGVRIVLADIGFTVMAMEIAAAEAERMMTKAEAADAP